MKKILFKLITTILMLTMVLLAMAPAYAAVDSANGFKLVTPDNGVIAAEGTNGFRITQNAEGSAFATSTAPVDLSKPITFEMQIGDTYGQWYGATAQWIMIIFIDDPDGAPMGEVGNQRGFVFQRHGDGDKIVVEYREREVGKSWSVYKENYGVLAADYQTGATFSVTIDLANSNAWEVLKVGTEIAGAYPANYSDFADIFDGDVYLSVGVNPAPSTADAYLKVTNVMNGSTQLSVPAPTATPEPTTAETTSAPTSAPVDETAPGDSGYWMFGLFSILALGTVFLTKKNWIKN